ncbi:serine/threonine-protein kinase ATG1c [Typha latifolia]|uniref:serine/threonine-protein kinase ATG1c n=1 Tax=Typha latifolia TaxID=4733 RepID=UPI003C2D2ABA
MATSMTMGRRGGGVGGRIVGDYLIVRQIGSGSYSVVWLGRHRVLGTEVAVKEIPMDKLSKKLQESLLFEASVLKRISHPNIINFYDFVQGPGRIYHILEYCRGGDLSKYIQRHGKVPEATAKHFIRQLASGLQVLRDNNVVHRDLKPQNLLLTAHEEYSVLKIADFGLARSLQPRDLAETMCGSPLYMAPEVMQNQKYDTKADLWSAGVILFQLVTGKTPFDGNNQMQLLQNIVKSNELSFPVDNNLSHDCIDLCRKLLRRKPVERITIEEFLNHQFLSEPILDGTFSRTLSDTRDGFPLIESSLARPSGESSQEDCMPFPLDDESSAQDQPMNRRSMRISYGFSLGTRSDKTPDFSPSKNVGLTSRYSSNNKKEGAGYKHDSFSGKPKEASISLEQAADSISRKDSVVSDSLEFVDQDYVIVSGPAPEISTSPVSAFRTRNSPCKSEGSPIRSPRFSAVSTPMEITGAPISRPRSIGSLGSHSSPASGTSQGSTDMGDHLDQPSAHFMTRIRSLQQYASVITELVKEEIANGTKLEAFSVQLVILAIWKQAMHICHAQAASAIGGSPSQEVKKREASGDASHSSTNSQLPDTVCTQIETDFLLEVDHAEELATDIGQIADATEMPDAIEIIFQCALTSGRHGAVDEMMGNAERAAIRYSKAACLLYFLLVEAPTLDLNPPFSLTNSDRYRIRQYIDVLKTRQRQLHPEKQRMPLKSHD